MTPSQCKAARALLHWTQKTLAKEAQVATSTVADFERYERKPMPNNLRAMIRAFENAEVQFIEGGVVSVKFLPRASRGI